MKKKIIGVIIIVCLLIGIALSISIDWLYNSFNELKLEEIIFQLKVPIEGADTTLVYEYLNTCLWKIILSTIILSIILIYPNAKDIKLKEKINIQTSNKKKTAVITIMLSLFILLISINKVVKATDIKEYISNQMNNSKFIENEYVDPKTAKIEFPEKKKNLIYIYLESMESTYYSQEDGELSKQNLIPELSKLAKENISFSNTDKLGGAYALYGATWTVGAMTAQSAGIPLKIGIEQNSLDQYSKFLDGAYTIGQVLEDNGYKNYILMGSEAGYAGRKNFYQQHGNYEIYDVNTAEEEGKINERVWWGFNDSILFEMAKEKLKTISKQDEPFNFTMLTVDTHFQDGYLCEDCDNKFDEQYKNVIACSSKKVAEFVKWVQEQDFYEDTTIVISGDHLSMQKDFFEIDENSEYEKTVINLFINSFSNTDNTKNRQFSTMDLYPTTLAALGVKIEGERLGLGTNLFSNEKTLLEKYGKEYVDGELRKTSKFYNSNILINNRKG